jgi:MFS family permease
MVWTGFFGFGWYGPWVSYIADTAPKDKLGLAMTANQLAVVVIVPLIGLSRDLFGSYIVSWAILILIEFFTFINIRRRNKVVLQPVALP